MSVITERDTAIAGLPDYGRDEVLRERLDQQLQFGVELNKMPFILDACASVVFSALDELRAGLVTDQWKPRLWRSDQVMIVNSTDELIAREALGAISHKEASLTDAPSKFINDVTSLTNELIRAKRADWLGYHEIPTIEWTKQNLLAATLMGATFNWSARVHEPRQVSPGELPGLTRRKAKIMNKVFFGAPTSQEAGNKSQGKLHPALARTAFIYLID